MRTVLLAFSLLAAALDPQGLLESQTASAPPGASSRDSYFTVHNIHPAHALTLGAGAKVGILDHSFGMDAHPELYAGGQNFQNGDWGETFRSQSHHGYWMALELRQIAPEAEIFALNTYSSDEDSRVQAMVEALDWAVTQGLDVVTYSCEGFSPAARKILDPAVDRAIDAGVVVVFLHYPHPRNVFPSWIGPRSEEDERDPDLNIFHEGSTVVFGDQLEACLVGDDALARGYRPFLSLSATAPVTAGFVALLRSLDPTLTPSQIKGILLSSSRPMEVGGRVGVRVPDLAEAVGRVRSQMVSRGQESY